MRGTSEEKGLLSVEGESHTWSGSLIRLTRVREKLDDSYVELCLVKRSILALVLLQRRPFSVSR